MSCELKQRTNTTSLQGSKAMLHTAYSAVRQLQEKKFPIHDFSALNELFSSKHLAIEIEISSSTVWCCTWCASDGSICGVLELHIRPRILDSLGNVLEPYHARRFCIQETSISKVALKKKILECVVSELQSLRS